MNAAFRGVFRLGFVPGSEAVEPRNQRNRGLLLQMRCRAHHGRALSKRIAAFEGMTRGLPVIVSFWPGRRWLRLALQEAQRRLRSSALPPGPAAWMTTLLVSALVLWLRRRRSVEY